MTTGPASLGWLSCPAGATLEGRLAGFVQRAPEPSRCHADRLPDRLLSTGNICVWVPAELAVQQDRVGLVVVSEGPSGLIQSFTDLPLDERPSYSP